MQPQCSSSYTYSTQRRQQCHCRPFRRVKRLKCYATIPVPPEPLGKDLGWRTDFEKHYVKGKMIGNGSFGTVFLGIDLHTAKEVAVKVMPKTRGKLSKERTLQKLLKETTILERLQHCANVVRLEGTFETEDEVYLVTEFCEGGDLQRLSDDVGALPERSVALIAYEVLQVIKACHDNSIVHGDVKPANFVLKRRNRNPLFSADPALLASTWLTAIDFGCSQLTEGVARFNKRTGTPVYMAPETFERNYSWESDMWSLGMMLYQLFARRFPFWDTYAACKSSKLDEVQQLVMSGDIPLGYGPWLGMSREGRDFVAQCLTRDYSRRLTVENALTHDWFRVAFGEAHGLGGAAAATATAASAAAIGAAAAATAIVSAAQRNNIVSAAAAAPRTNRETQAAY